MTYQSTLVYDENLLRKAVLHFWWRSLGVKFVLVLAVAVCGLAVLVASGDRSWLMGVCASATILGIGFPIALYLMHYRNTLAKFKAMGQPQAQFTVKEETFSFSSGAGEATLPWSSVVEVWQFQEVWLLLFSRAHFSTLPLACMPSGMQTFILERIKATGGRIA
jgi:hypothetical protein